MKVIVEDIVGAKGRSRGCLHRVGLQVMQRMMEEEVTALVGPKGKYTGDGRAVRHGQEDRSVVLGGRRVPVKRSQARSTGGPEVWLQSYEDFQDEHLLTMVPWRACCTASPAGATATGWSQRGRTCQPATPPRVRSADSSFGPPASRLRNS